MVVLYVHLHIMLNINLRFGSVLILFYLCAMVGTCTVFFFPKVIISQIVNEIDISICKLKRFLN